MLALLGWHVRWRLAYNGWRYAVVLFYGFEIQNTINMEELIKKHLENWTGLKKSSIENYVETGKVSGSFFMALKEMMKEYLEDQVKNNAVLPLVSGSLPNEIDLGALANLLKYSAKYQISIQFWPDQTAVFIEKDNVELKDFGGGFDFAVSKSIAYLDRITGNDR